jgi:RNA polymerase sigma-70 factor (ECF subfamily)
MKSGEATRTETPQECSSSARLNETPHLAREIVWAEYLRRVATRDEFALEALFQETHALVFATALRIASFRSDAEEIAADVFVRVWASAASYDVRRGPVGAWLVRIARNCAVDQLRAAAVRQRCETGLLSRCVSCAPEATIDVEQTKASLARALQGLSVRQRRAIELFYFSELPVADIAAALRCPVGTVKTRLRTGVLNLRRLMAALESAGPVCPSTPVAARLAGFSPSCAHSVNLTSAVNP